MKKIIPRFVLLAALMAAVGSACAAATITVQTDQPGAPINHGMWGVFFEDINLGADGGLYAELVKNRSFEFPDALMGWMVLGQTNGVAIRDDAPFSRVQPHYVRLQSGTGMANEGFRGIGVTAGDKYDFSVQARVQAGSPALEIQLVDATGKILRKSASKTFPPAGSWKKSRSRRRRRKPRRI